MKHRSTFRLLSLLLFALAPACGGGGGAPQEAPATADTLVHSLSDEALHSFEATVRELRLVRAGGGASDDLLPGPTRLELVSLEDLGAWVSNADLPAGTFEAVQLEIAPDDVVARLKDGTQVAVAVQSTLLEAPFPAPVTIGPGGYGRLDVRFDLHHSLSGALELAQADLLPEGFADETSTEGSVPLDDLRGLVVDASLEAGTVDVKVFLDEELAHCLGVVTVLVSEDTLLVDTTALEFDSVEAFFASLQPGATVVDVQGDHVGEATLEARKITIVDHSGGPVLPLVVIEGIVGEVDPATGFRLLVQSVEKGAAIADPVLDGLGQPLSIEVAVDADTQFFLGWKEGASVDDLESGQQVQVGFVEFEGEPFPAVRVEIVVELVKVEGVIVDVAELPDAFTIEVKDDEAALWGSCVDPATQELRVELDEGTRIELDVQGHPLLAPGDLLVGMKVQVAGEVQPADEPQPEGEEPAGPADTFLAHLVRVHHGHFIKGALSSFEPGGFAFTTDTSQIVQSFGVLVSDGPLQVLVHPDARFVGDVGSAEGLACLAEKVLGTKIGLDVKVKGIGSGQTDEVVAYELKVKLEKLGPGSGFGQMKALAKQCADVEIEGD